MLLYRYNQEKTLNLIRSKVIRLATHLHTINKLHAIRNLSSSNFNPSAQILDTTNSTHNVETGIVLFPR